MSNLVGATYFLKILIGPRFIGARKIGDCLGYGLTMKNLRSCEGQDMPNFSHHFQNQAKSEVSSSSLAPDALSLSTVLQYAESAQKQSFEALCRMQPLIKTYRDKVIQTSQAMSEASTSLGVETKVPPAFIAALALVQEGFSGHIEALDEWMRSLTQKGDARVEPLMAKVKDSGARLEQALQGFAMRE